MKKILILSASQKYYSDQKEKLLSIFKDDNSIEVTFKTYKEICLEIEDNKVNVYTTDNIELNDYTFVYFFTQGDFKFIAFAIAQYLIEKSIPFIDLESNTNYAINKINEFILLAYKDIPLIDSFYSSKEYILSTFENNPRYQYPFVMKDVTGKKGMNNFLVKNYSELSKIFEEKSDIQFVIQPFIQNDCDYRILTFDFKSKMIIKRTRKDDSTHLNNTSTGGIAEIISIDSLDKEIISVAEKSAKILNRNLAGVDVVIDNKGRFFILEVNSSPQLITGTFVEEKMELLKEYLLSK